MAINTPDAICRDMDSAIKRRLGKQLHVGLLIVGILTIVSSSASAQSTLFQSPPSTDTFKAVFQNNSPSSPTIGAKQTTGNGTTISIDSFSGVGGDVPALIACATTVGSTDQLGLATYCSGGTPGTESKNPLALGTASATPNVFNLGAGQTFTYAVEFHNNFHCLNIISLFNPKAADAGTTDPTALTKGGYLGIALTLSTSASEAALSLQGLNSFAANSLDAASETISVTPNGSNVWRLVLKLTNNGNGTDTVSGSVYSLELQGGVVTETLSATLKPATITLGTSNGNYDLDNATIGLELGVDKIVNLNNKFYMTNISLTKAEGSAP